jgi:hypothetical protein
MIASRATDGHQKNTFDASTHNFIIYLAQPHIKFILFREVGGIGSIFSGQVYRLLCQKYIFFISQL